MHRPAPWWTSAVVRWHVWRVVLIWAGVRMLVTIAFALASDSGPPGMAPASPIEMATAPTTALITGLVAMLVAEVDRRRIGAPLLFANLGYSAKWVALTTGAIVVSGEVLWQVVMRVVGGRP